MTRRELIKLMTSAAAGIALGASVAFPRNRIEVVTKQPQQRVADGEIWLCPMGQSNFEGYLMKEGEWVLLGKIRDAKKLSASNGVINF